jgi:hypothetical protein
MDAVSSVTKEMFRRYFIAALINIGIPIDQANLFCCINQTKSLVDFGICTVISMKLDDFMEARVPDYKGCMPKDTWKDIINYNFSDD